MTALAAVLLDGVMSLAGAAERWALAIADPWRTLAEALIIGSIVYTGALLALWAILGAAL